MRRNCFKHLMPMAIAMVAVCLCQPAAAQMPQADVAQANSRAMTLMQAGNYQQALEALQRVDSASNHQKQRADSTLAMTYHLMGQCTYPVSQYASKGVQWLQQAIQWRKQLPGCQGQLIESYQWLGNLCRYRLQQPYAAIEAYQAGLQLAEHDTVLWGQHLQPLNYNLATSYRVVKDYARGLQYGRRALHLVLAHDASNKTQLARHYNMLGALYAAGYHHTQAVHHYTLAIAAVGLASSRALRYQNNLAEFYLYASQPDSARYWVQQSIAHNLASHNNNPLLANSYYVLGKCLEGTDTAAAGAYFQKAITLFRASYGNNHWQIAEVYRHWGRNYVASNPARAIALLDSALVRLWPGTPPHQMAVAPLPRQANWEPLFVALHNRGLALANRGQSQNNRQALQQALSYHQRAIAIYQQYRHRHLQQAGLLQQAHWYQWLLDEALTTLHRYYNAHPHDSLLATAWQLIETGKSALLLQSFQQNQARHRGGLPDSLWQQHKQMSYHINQQAGTDTAYYWQRRLVQWQGHVAAHYPTYHRFTTAPLITPWQQALAAIKPHETVINYWQGAHQWYALGGQPGNMQFWVVPKTEALTNALSQYLYFVRHQVPELISTDAALRVRQAGHTLFQEFVEPVWPAVPPANASLTVLPHGPLEGLPFAALLTQPPNGPPMAFHTYPFLIKQMPVSHAFGGSHWVQSRLGKSSQSSHSSSSSQITYLGMAWQGPAAAEPPATRNQHLAALPYSAAEVTQASQLWQGSTYLGRAATEGRFKAMAPQANILHLALHGTLNTKGRLYSDAAAQPALYFPAYDSLNDGLLHLHEVYRLNLKAQVTILSACETGQGPFAAGEGVMSLARGFAYAGCPTVLASLWRLHDGTAKTIITQWHQQARQGIPLHVALQQSQLHYLQQADALQAHPGRWAAMVLVGNSPPLQAPPARHTNYLAICLLLLLAGGAVVVMAWRKPK